MRLIAAIACVLAGVPQNAVAQTAGSNQRFLVIPFDNPAREARVFWLGEASAVLIADDLNALGRRAYTREERLDAFGYLQVPPVAALSRATMIRLGQVVGATHVLTGSFRLTGSQLSVHAQSIRLDTGRMEEAVVESGSLEDLFGVFGRLSQRLAGMTPPFGAITRPPLPVFESYIKGLIAASTAAKITYLEAALKLDPSFDRARLALWHVHHDEGNSQQALAVLSAVSDTSPHYSRARFATALSLIQLNRLDEAFSTLRALADRSAASATVLNNLGVIQQRRAATPQAGRATYYFNQAIKADPDDPDYYFNLGYAYWAEKDVPAATFWLREAVRRNPADGEAHAVLAAALQSSGATAEAARERELATQLSSVYAAWAKKPAGIEPIPRGLERLKSSPEVSTLGRVDAAIATPGQRDQKELAAFHLDRGRRFYEQGANEDAVRELRRALYLSPYEAEAHLLLGRVYLRSGQTATAIDAFKIALWSQDSAEGRIALARAYLQLKDDAQARASLQRALELDANAVEARDLLSQIKP